MKNDKKYISMIVVVMVIGLLMVSGPARAINLGVSDILDSQGNPVDEISANEEISFTAKVDLHTDDVMPEDVNLTVVITGGAEDVMCSFDVSGEATSACTGLTVSLVSSSEDYVYSEGRFAYGYGYNYTSSSYEEGAVIFGYGYGFGYAPGVGYDDYTQDLSSTAEFIYNITWTTPDVASETEYSIELRASSASNTDFEFRTLTQNVGSITVQPADVVLADDIDEEGNLEVEDTNLVITDPAVVAALSSITVNESIDEDEPVTLNLSAFVEDSVLELPNELTLVRESDLTYTVVIPAGTNITGPAGWDGVITLPTVKLASNYDLTSATVNVVVNVGSSSRLNFTQPVKITISDMAGKVAAWAGPGETDLTEIETECDDDDSPTNVPEGEECYIDSGDDLVIWTYHFTVFAAVTPDEEDDDDDDGGSSGGGSGGGETVGASKVSTLFTKLEAGKPVKMTVSETSPTELTEILFTLNKAIEEAKLSVERMANKPGNLPAPPGKAYGFYNIQTVNLKNVDFDGVVRIKFKVKQSWLTQNSATEKQVVMMRYVDGGWVKLTTKVVQTKGGNVYLEAETPGFSYFAVTLDALAPAPVVKDTTPVVEKEEKEDSEASSQAETSTKEDSKPVVATTTTQKQDSADKTGSDDVKSKSSGTWLWVMLGLILVAIVAAFFMKGGHKKKRGRGYKSLL